MRGNPTPRRPRPYRYRDSYCRHRGLDDRGGARVAVKDLDGDVNADLVVGAGTGAGSRVTGYLGKDVQPAGVPPAAFDFDAFPGFTGGVFVG